ncbi:sensor histidine kinase [Eggerthella sinensis]|uniref:sensor histidine kinase n=1 Tax=Eggerthella sinensis TaxID=242230 RepID=UPI001D05D8B4|nr:ATP-binding protein [Eggerthella sinensis]MCB7037558.1 sensor histidine kinase [Eggerthella sinensis]
MTMVFAGLFALALAAAVWFAARLALLKRSLRQVNDELGEIVEHLEDSRIVKLPQPSAELEALLGTVNRALEGIRRQAVTYARREAQLKTQIESMSHDLRTPLTAIVGYLALVDEAELDDETRASLVTVRRKADALQRLIASFYELSQVQGAGAQLERAKVDAGRVAREAVTGQYRLLEQRGLRVELRLPERPLPAWGDAHALERVMENLVHNAGKYARSAFEVEAAVADEGRSVVVTCANDVEGPTTFEVGRLFEPFYTADAARSTESSGLGLAIARSLVEQMGGTLEAQLDEREGASWLRFRMELPAAG